MISVMAVIMITISMNARRSASQREVLTNFSISSLYSLQCFTALLNRSAPNRLSSSSLYIGMIGCDLLFSPCDSMPMRRMVLSTNVPIS